MGPSPTPYVCDRKTGLPEGIDLGLEIYTTMHSPGLDSMDLIFSTQKTFSRGSLAALSASSRRNSLDFWKGFCVRSFDFTELQLTNVDEASLSEAERETFVWPAMLRTAIHTSQTFLRRVSQSTGLELVNVTDVGALLRHMQASEFIVASKMEEMLLERVANETAAFGLLKTKTTGRKDW